MSSQVRNWIVIPAAGIGRRMGAAMPKQYMALCGRPVIDYALELFVHHPWVSGVLVALDSRDEYWSQSSFSSDPRVRCVKGGAERCNSVLNALDALSREASEADWVLVHDAARPCLRRDDLDRLLACLGEHPVGGLLGVPVRDTMKRSGKDGAVSETVPREDLWHAFTPQMFRVGLLRRALHAALDQNRLLTDDAGAIELMGLGPMMIEGHADNIKITRPEDLPLAAFYLRQQGRAQ